METSRSPEMTLSRIGDELRRLKIHDVSSAYQPSLPLLFAMPKAQVRSIDERTPEADFGVPAHVWELPEHSGSHVESPSHFVSGGAPIDDLPADVLFFRPFKKFDISADERRLGEPVSRERLVAAAERSGFALEAGDVAIVDFGWDRCLPGGSVGEDGEWWGLNEPGLSADACEYLASAGVQAVACDTSVCDLPIRDGQITGAAGPSEWLLPNGILIIEGLVGLSAVPPTGMLAALPRKLGKGTSSLRVLLLTE